MSAVLSKAGVVCMSVGCRCKTWRNYWSEIDAAC